MNYPKPSNLRNSSTRTRPVPKSPMSKFDRQRAASPQTKQKSTQSTVPRSKSTPKRGFTSPTKNKQPNLAKKSEIEMKASEDRIKNYQKEITRVEKNSALECERLKREIQDMQTRINSGIQLESMQKEISSLQKQRDELKEEIAERNRNQSEIADITNEYDNLEAQLETLQNDKIHFEEEMTRIMAINDVLLEHMKNSPKYSAYKENARLRNEKRALTEKLQKYSEDICQQRSFRAKTSMQFIDDEVPTNQSIKKALQENEAAENQRQELLNRISQLKEQRHRELFDAFRNEAAQAYADYDASKNEVSQLEQREKQLKSELAYLQSSSRTDVPFQELQVTKAQYRQAREEYINAQQEYHKNLVWELQLRIENETNQMRQAAASHINELKAEQQKLKEQFLSLQDSYNRALSDDSDSVLIGNGQSVSIEEAQNEIDRVQKVFGQIGDEIQKIASEEAKKELDLADQEYREMQEISGDINKWISDLHLSSLQSQSREEALRSQIDILNRRLKHPSLNYEHEMAALLERAQNDSQKLNNQLIDSKRRLRELDVMLGAPDNDDVSLEQRFQSIQERIAALLDDTDDSPMKLDRMEQDLKDKLAKLKGSK